MGDVSWEDLVARYHRLQTWRGWLAYHMRPQNLIDWVAVCILGCGVLAASLSALKIIPLPKTPVSQASPK